jgi:hypothetical protein
LVGERALLLWYNNCDKRGCFYLISFHPKTLKYKHKDLSVYQALVEAVKGIITIPVRPQAIDRGTYE